MNQKKKIISGIIAFFTMLVIILDTKTAINGTKEGIELCLQTVIPSLFPFFVLSGIINNRIWGASIAPIRPIAKLCKVPKGAESILLLGFIAGYPVGAQLISRCCTNKQLPTATAKRMLGFCNNAGPAFIFGILSHLFENPLIPWILWAIHISSALIVGIIIPSTENKNCVIHKPLHISLSQSLNNAIKTTATVSAWVIVFRIILNFCNRWFLWIFSPAVQALLSGFLELSNGCTLLNKLPQQGMRFLLASIMLAFGGVCVAMQTVSVTEALGSGMYFPGKCLQTALALIFSIVIQPFLFEKTQRIFIPIQLFLLLIFLFFLFVFFIRRKSCSIQQ